MNLRELGVKGCLEGYCHIVGEMGPGRMHTNGGCHCLKGLPSIERRNLEKALMLLRQRISELEEDINGH